MPNKEWSGKIPCCAPPCPPHNVMDVYILLDSSDLVGAEDWILMKEYVKQTFQGFSFSADSTKISIMRYNNEVDTKNLISLDDYSDKPSEFWYAFDSLPYDGTGSNLGQAIQYLTENMMAPEAGNRLNVLDVVIIFTTGKSDDDYVRDSVNLQATGAFIQVFVVPKTKLSDLDTFRLFHLVGYDMWNLSIKQSYETLLATLSGNTAGSRCSRSCQQDESLITVEAGEAVIVP
ncbi:collagen alpha-1(XIV) chain-like [Styela clava]